MSSKLNGLEFDEIYRNNGSLETSKQVQIPACTNCHCKEKCANRSIVSV